MKVKFRFRDSGKPLFWYTFLVVVIPLVSMAVLGFLFLWQQELLLYVVLGWLAVTLIAFGFYAQSIKPPEFDGDSAVRADALDSLPEILDEPADWSEQDREVWRRACVSIEQYLRAPPAWDDLQGVVLALLGDVAGQYHGTRKQVSLRFSLPEALLLLSVASARYRDVVLDHVPFADRITVATLFSLYDKQSRVKSGISWLNRARRAARFVNPVAAVISEVRDQFTGHVFNHVSQSLQRDLMRLLLQEIVQVSIDLYSGRLKVSDTELASYRSTASIADEQRTAKAVEPLRVIFLGQISAGKSSLINALINAVSAETDLLPSTDQLTVHGFSTDNGDEIHLVDTPGLDGSAEQRDQLVQFASDADLIVYVLRATQSARAPDHDIVIAISELYEDVPSRRQAPTLMVLTHIDQLPPRNEWAPPYDLNAHTIKSDNIVQAMDSARSAVNLPATTSTIPVCTSRDLDTYNVDAVHTQIMMQVEDASLTQLNRRRMERVAQPGSWRLRWDQLVRLGRAAGKLVR